MRIDKITIKQILYFFWIIFSLISCAFLLIILYPNYENNEFPLFTDLTLLIYIPSFFVFSSTISHLFLIIIGNELNDNYKLHIRFFIVIISFLFSLTFMEFDMGIRVIISVISFIITIPHSRVTEILYKKMIQ